MYRFITCVAVVLLITALTAPVGAYPSLTPWTGTGNLPTAEVQESGSVALAVDFLPNKSTYYQDLKAIREPETISEDVLPARLVWGVNDKLEVGAGYQDEFSSKWLFATKYQIESDDSGSIAVGALYSQTDEFAYSSYAYRLPGLIVPDEEMFQLYVARTFPLGKTVAGKSKLNATIGANWTTRSWESNEFTDGYEDNAVRLFASLQAKYGKTLFAFDYQSSHGITEESPMWSMVGRYDISPRLTGQMGYSNAIGWPIGGQNRFFAGVCYTLGK